MRDLLVRFVIVILAAVSPNPLAIAQEDPDCNWRDESFKEGLHALAKAGDPEAQYCLGLAYYLGKQSPDGDRQALQWFSQAATQGTCP